MTYVDANRVFLEHFEKVFLDVLEDQIKTAFALESLLQGNNVLILEHAEHSDLSHDCLLGDLVVIRLLKLLYSDYRHKRQTENRESV